MRIKIVFVLAVFFAFPVFSETLSLPDDSFHHEKKSALSILRLCTAHDANLTKDVFSEFGFKILLQKNYGRPSEVIDHTSAYTIGLGKVLIGTETVPAYLIAIRGTDGNEWYSDFDFSFDADGQNHFASNFLSSAEDVFLDCISQIKNRDAVIIVSGHSRGAAVANILALLLNQIYAPSKIYAYTYACPATVKNISGIEERNVFNFINPCDLVPNFPLAGWGFRRAGTDVLLDEKSEKISAEKIREAIDSILKICPSAESFYRDRHSLVRSGLSENGMTCYELMMAIGTRLAGLRVDSLETGRIDLKPLGFKIPSFDTGSDFHALFKYLSHLSRNDGEGFADLLDEHLPETYRKKLTECR